MTHAKFCRTRALALILATALFAPLSVFAQGKITKIVVAFPPGGPVDFVARTLSEQLGKELGHQVIVESKAGANGAIAADHVIRSAPDGQTLWLSSVGAVAINPALYDKLPYDPVRDLAPVSLIVNNVELLVVNPSNPANSGAEFVANASKPDKSANMASSGTGSVPHLAMELLADASKARLVHVPYKGAAPAITDVMAGHVDGFFGDIPGLISFVRSGKLKPIGIAATKRHPLLPDVKTFQEMGIPGVDSDNWYALFASKATPAEEINRINQAVRRTLATEAVRSKLMASGAVPSASSPAELASLLKSDMAKWARVIKAKSIKPD
ncbi:MAG: tripartite tricarboxylate transporter substrate binding protein [Gammaproteobacteria bacterium]|nr:tripartite tricarboxylate transporter substrate binding protein [Gammaproteobacteria bacterium]MBU0788481.1 tripartite tricarboxylate transporter substrate binding protein [Gammaproteobacteria bacterium]MBU0815695.1 tripartite tricarboxylate transporter substrate binding protein [Gammaproteobacteria bacterium]MBU1788097.1 tripartite tricarboxylate transporter substrate binding protein [Gammaproteobacteria bacterium]